MASMTSSWIPCIGPGLFGTGCGKGAKASKGSVCKRCRAALITAENTNRGAK